MIGTLLLVSLQQATLAGVVRDSVDLEPIAFAQVTVAAGDAETLAATGISDRFGAFVIADAPGGRGFRVVVSAFGYESWERDYDQLPAEPVRVLLRPAPIGLEGITVTRFHGPGTLSSWTRRSCERCRRSSRRTS